MKSVILITTLIAIAGPAGLDRDEKDIRSEMADMQLVEGATFRMGDVFAEGVRLATPVRDVTVSSF